MFQMIVPKGMDKITENLYLGSVAAAEDIDNLKKLGIKKVLSLLEFFHFPKYKKEDNIIHKKIEIRDFDTENIIKYFGECLKFIEGDDKILVHCMVGSSRSASFVIVYIMWNKKMSFKEAFEYVKSKRKTILPNPGFSEQLELFEKELIEKNYDIDKINFSQIKWEPKDYCEENIDEII